MLDTDKIYSFFQTSPSIRLITRRSASVIVAFFYYVFKTTQQTTIFEEDFIDALASVLEDNDIEDFETTDKLFDYEDKAKRLINQWVKPENNFLRCYEDVENKTVYELTSHSEKVIQWIEQLDTQEFIGTESRFKDIFNKVNELIENTTEDKEKRVEELESRKKEIENEIREIKLTGKVKTYDDYQIKSRIHEITLSAKELISDFKEVEANFKEITRDIYQKHTDPDQTKGSILDYTFDALDSLKDSDQGKSFYAFWNFLISQNRQDEWQYLIRQLFDLLNDKEIEYDAFFLRKLKTFLFHAGVKVSDANDRMSDKLSRVISEKELSERIKVKESINRIKELALGFADKGIIPSIDFSIEHRPFLNLPMEKKLTFSPKENTKFITKISDAPSQLNPDIIEELVKQHYIDKKRLNNNIKDVLIDYPQASLKQILKKYPLKDGLPELLTYVLLADKDPKCIFDKNAPDKILFDTESKKYIELPQIIFCK